MDPIDPVHGTATLLLIAAAAVAVLLFLIMAVRLHAFIALVLVSLVTAVAAGIPMSDVPTALTSGFGSTLASVALLVAFGVMLGRLLEVTGGAQVLADTLVGRFGEKRAPFALGVAALIFGFPIFFDAGLVVFLPIILTVARRFGGSVLYYALPAAGAFAAMHALVPPHPGPVAAGTVLGGDIGIILLVNLPIALVSWYVGVYLVSRFLGARIDVPLPDLLFGEVNGGAGRSGGTSGSRWRERIRWRSRVRQYRAARVRGPRGRSTLTTTVAPPSFATVVEPARDPAGADRLQHRADHAGHRRDDRRGQRPGRAADPDRQHPRSPADHGAGRDRRARHPRPHTGGDHARCSTPPWVRSARSS